MCSKNILNVSYLVPVKPDGLKDTTPFCSFRMICHLFVMH
nr:unnamed protein product [Callosobruchus chinensis]